MTTSSTAKDSKAMLEARPEIEVVVKPSMACLRLGWPYASLHVILMDVRMPGLNGIDATCWICAGIPRRRAGPDHVR